MTSSSKSGGSDPLGKLEHLQLLTRVCDELEKGIKMGDAELGEMVIELAEEGGSEQGFVRLMTEHIGEGQEQFLRHLWNVMASVKATQRGGSDVGGGGGKSSSGGEDRAFPGLAIPDEEVPRPVDLGDALRPSRRRGRDAMEDASDVSAPAAKRHVSSVGIGGGDAIILRGKVTLVRDAGATLGLDGAVREGFVPRRFFPDGGLRVGMEVWASVVESGVRPTLSVRDVDQLTGEEVRRGSTFVDPSVGVGGGGGGGKGRSRKRLSEQERYELKQLAASGVRAPDEVAAELQDDEEEDEVVEIDVAEKEPAFLRGQTALTRELSPIHVVKNPDGSMARAALHQGELVKEKRELTFLERQAELDSVPKDLSRAWADPMAGRAERHLAVDLQGLGQTAKDTEEEPEWRKKSLGASVALGKKTKLSIREQRANLPIAKLREEFLAAVADNQVIVVLGETGSGKTTQMPQYLAEAGYTKRGMVGVTQPRRVAAISVAERVAEEVGCRNGEEVGYSIRFEDKTSPATQIKFMTDGMLLREYLADRDLKRYSVIMLDEAHERTINTDVLFGLLKQMLRRRRDLRIIVTSATLDAEKFSTFFFDCPIFKIPGRMHPVRTHHVTAPVDDYLDASVNAAIDLHLKKPPGDILLFLTGEEEINNACDMLYERVRGLGPEVPELIILPAYAALPSEMQSKIFEPAPAGSRKIVVATNIAEASLTIDGILFVIDPGFVKQKVYDPKLGMDSLVVVPISQASATQRRGRAGRTAPGECFRLYTKDAFENEMLPMSVPEIQRSNLAAVVLNLKAMGINDLLHFPFMDPPPTQVLVNALLRLYALNAIDEEGLLTRLGRRMAEFPLDPSLSKTLLTSVELGCSAEVLTIVAVLSVDTVFHRPRDKQAAADQKHARFFQPEGDHISNLVVFQSWEQARRSPAWARDNFLNHRNLNKALEVRNQLVGIMERYKLDIVSCGRDFTVPRKAIVAGYFMNVARRDPKEGYLTVVEGQPVFIHPGSSLFQRQPTMVLYHEIVRTSKEYMRGCLAVQPAWLVELAPRFYEKADPTKMTRSKKREKLEPLYDRFNPPDSWRLSRRLM